MKKREYEYIEKSIYRKNIIMFIQTLEEVLFYYSFESYKMPALNSHFLCWDLLQTKNNIDNKLIMEGNFIPLAEEFENVIENDIVLKAYIPEIDVILKRRDKLGVIVDYKKADLKAKINKYAEAAGYIREISEANDIYLNTIFNKLVENIFTEKNEYSNWNAIYSLTRILVTELVNVGYSPEYISHEMRKTFLDNRIKVKCEEQLLINFFSKFTFESKSYQVILGINAETAKILHYLKDITVKEPTGELRKQLNLNHKGDCIVELFLEDLDKYETANAGCGYINTIIGLHRISQHHKPVYIKPFAQINEIDDELNILSSRIIKIDKNILLRANNESQVQSYFFDNQLLNKVQTPETFLRAVSLHNSALDSKEPTNQLLDLWTAVETMIGFKSGDEDKINVVCDILTSVLNRTYLYTHMVQLHKDILAVLGEVGDKFISNVSGDEQIIWKLAKVLSVSAYQKDYDILYELLEEYPLLQYRMENFSKKIFADSKSVYEELIRHKQKIRWQIMRIYRNRNMIVHNGEHMPYLDIILGNLHYYIDAMFDLLIEYYHLGIKKNQYIFYHVQKEEVRYWNILGLDEKGKKITPQEITELNYSTIIFNGYEGNAIKNVVKEAIANMERKHLLERK